MTSIAIDFGNENCLIAIPNKGGVDIISNQASQRITPTMVAFSETRRYHGIFAQHQQMQNVKNTLTQIKRLIGLTYDSPELKEIQNLITYQIIPGVNEKHDQMQEKDNQQTQNSRQVDIKVEFLNHEQIFNIHQIIAYLIKGLFQIANLNKFYTDRCVIVVSPWWNEIQRKIIINSAKIAGYEVVRLINSTTAEAITYQMYHRKLLPNNEKKYVAFIDFGDCCLNASIVQYYDGMLEVKGYCCDEHIGGSNFTTALVNFLLKTTKDKYKIDPTNNPRAMLRFYNAAEKLKKGLSINPVMPFDVPSLMNDIDVNFLVKRTDFEEQITDLVQRIAEPIEKSLKFANVKKEDLFAIEVHGGASRVPAVKAKIAEVFGKEPTQSLNPDECFALGAGFQAALCSSQFVVNLKIKDVFQYKIALSYKDIEGKENVKELFSQYQPIPCTKIFTVKVQRQVVISLYSDNVKLGDIDIRPKTDDVVNAKVKIRLTQDGIVDVQDVTYNEEIIESISENKIENNNEKVNETENKENNAENDAEKSVEKGENDEKKEIKKKHVEVKIPFRYKLAYGLSEKEIKEYQEKEKEMMNIDSMEEAIDNVKNSLESYIFQTKNAIERDYTEFFDPNKINEYKAKVDETFMWFSENEFDRLPLQEYQTKLNELKEFGEPALKRNKFRQLLPSQIKELVDRIEKCRAFLMLDDPLFKYIPIEKKTSLDEEFQKIISDIENAKNKISQTPGFIDVTFDSSEYSNQIFQVEKKVNELMIPDPEILKAQAEASAQTEAQQETQTEAQQETQQETQTEAQQETQTEAQTEAQQEAQTEAQQETQTETQQETQQETQTETQ